MAIRLSQGTYTTADGLPITGRPVLRVHPILDIRGRFLQVQIQAFASEELYHKNLGQVELMALPLFLNVGLFTEVDGQQVPSENVHRTPVTSKDVIDEFLRFVNEQYMNAVNASTDDALAPYRNNMEHYDLKI